MKKLLAGILSVLLFFPLMSTPAYSVPAHVCLKDKNHPKCLTTPSPTITRTPTPTFTTTPTSSPTIAATPTPTNSPSRPFPPPVTTATYTVPSTINSTGTVDVYTALNNWINSVPNGSIISFPSTGTYLLSRGIQIGNRNNLVFQGNGATLRLSGVGTSHQSSAFIVGFSYSSQSFTGNGPNFAIHNFNIIGNDPTPGVFDGGGENQHGIRCNGTTFLEVSNVTVRGVYGDHTFLDNCNDVWVHHNHAITASRNGLTIIKGFRILGESNAFDTVGYATFDLEPNFSTEASADITYRNNTGGTWQNGIGFVSIDGAARGADIRRVTITGNTATGRALQIYIDNKDGVNGNPAGRMQDIVVTDNKGPSGGVLRFRNIDRLTTLRNNGTYTVINCTSVSSDGGI